jgi:hypothetical protein
MKSACTIPSRYMTHPQKHLKKANALLTRFSSPFRLTVAAATVFQQAGISPVQYHAIVSNLFTVSFLLHDFAPYWTLLQHRLLYGCNTRNNFFGSCVQPIIFGGAAGAGYLT